MGISTIITNGGRFYLNTTVSIAGLMILWPEAKVIRVKDEDNFNFDFNFYSLFVGVGNKYNPQSGMYDLHGFTKSYRVGGAGYDVFGLVWKSFGNRICEKVLSEYSELQVNFEEVAKVTEERFVIPIDGLRYNPKYTSYPSTLQELAMSFNPPWFAKEKDYDKQFLIAVEVFQKLLKNQILEAASEILAGSIIRESISVVNNVGVLESYVPWGNLKTIVPEVKFLVLPEQDSDCLWRVYPVIAHKVSFSNSWIATHPEKLRESLGIKGLVRLHPKGFYGVFNNKSDAIRFAILAFEHNTLKK